MSPWAQGGARRSPQQVPRQALGDRHVRLRGCRCQQGNSLNTAQLPVGRVNGHESVPQKGRTTARALYCREDSGGAMPSNQQAG